MYPLSPLTRSHNCCTRTRKKYEICTGEEFNPIYQDVKNGALRSYAWGDMCFNYGAIPQTWEDPQHYTDAGQSMIDPSKAVHAKGDNDPIDVLELGGRSWPMGSVVPVRKQSAMLHYVVVNNACRQPKSYFELCGGGGGGTTANRSRFWVCCA